MTQVKLIWGATIKSLEHEINMFLDGNSTIRVVDIKLNDADSLVYPRGFVAMIIYQRV